MFDIGWQELFVVAAITLIVVGPRDLPRVLKTVMGLVRKARSMAREFQGGIDEVVREVELDDLRREANAMANMDMEDEIKSALDPTGDLEKDMDLSDVQSAMADTAAAVNNNPDSGTGTGSATATLSAETFGGAGPSDDLPDAATDVDVPANKQADK